MFDSLIQEISLWPQVEAIALGGSRAGTHFDEKSDYDVYLHCTGPVSEAVRREVLGRFCSYMEIGNHFWEYEDNCTLHSGVDIDILYRDLDDFVQGLVDVVECHNPHNGYTTCMWHNLRTCRILVDKSGRLTDAKRRFDIPYPDALRRNIILRNDQLLEGTMPAYTLQISKALKRGDLVSVNHRTAAYLESYFDILFALNRLTHPGEKRLIQLCEDTCSLLPADFRDNLNALFSHMFVDPEAASDDLRRITSEIRKLYDF